MESNRSSKRQASSLWPPPPSPPPLPLSHQNEAAEDDDEEKVEKFFALIGNIKAMKDLWEVNNRHKRSRLMERSSSSSVSLWKPTFEWEDFQQEKQIESREEKGRKVKKEGEENENSLINLNLPL